MGDILVTGANGYLGGIVTKTIIEKTAYGILAVASSEEKVADMIKRMNIRKKSRIRFLSNINFIKTETKLENIDGAIHLAFARRTHPAADIAESLLYAERVFKKLSASGIDRIINTSSQGIYGDVEEFKTENTRPAPTNHYTMAKYASEILFNSIMRDVEHHTNLRLDLVAQSQNVIQALCQQAIEGKIYLKGGRQCFSFIDGDDAGNAIVAMLLAAGEWDSVYNVGWNRNRYTLLEVADIIANMTEKCGIKRPEIILDKQEISLWAGMDSSKFVEKTGWKPSKKLSDTVTQILLSKF